MNKTTEALELAEALENDAKEHREVSYGLDCPPERTANWKHALNCEAAARLIREVLAESKPAPDGRIPKTVFTLDDISKAAEMGKQAGMIDALAEPVKQEPEVCQFPRQSNNEGGWTIEAKFLNALVKDMADDEFAVGMEETEAVLLALERIYTAPVFEKREWVDLTCEEVTELIREGAADGGWQGFAIRLQTAFKEKNK